MTEVLAKRRRPRTALANDVLIRQSAISLLAHGGIAGFTLSAVARTAELSHTATSQRFADRDDLLCDVWENVLCAHLDVIISWAETQLDKPAAPADLESPATKSLLLQSDETLAFVELLSLAVTTPKLRRAVRESFDTHVRAVSTDNLVRATQLSFLIAMMIGAMCELRTTKANLSVLAKLIEEVVGEVSEPTDDVALPNEDASYLDVIEFDSGDVKRDAILASCLDNVAQHGFENTTTRMIVQQAGVSEGLLFSMFGSKLDVFIEASMLHTRRGFQKNLDFVVEVTAKYGIGIANALLMREMMHPSRSKQRAIAVEQIRMTWHDAALRRRIDKNKKDLFDSAHFPRPALPVSTAEERATQLIELAIPTGLYLLAELFPRVANLPFVIVTQNVFK